MQTQLTRCIGLLSICWLVACHDTRRDNPLDPVLTPAVSLTTVIDSTSGVVALSWTPYSGETRFDRYLVLRNVANRTEVDTLTVITDAGQTTYTDASLVADTAYEYRILVVNDEGFAPSSARSRVDGFTVRAVTLLSATGDPSAGAIEIIWSRYRDPGFAAYQLFRRVAGTDAEELLNQFSSATDTTFTDTAARHGVNYIYRVAAETASGSLPSASRDARLELPAVAITRIDFDSRSASASLQWTAYSGPRFSHYRIERQDETAWITVDTPDQVTDTGYMDLGLRGNTEYSYRIVTVTVAGEETSGAVRTGAFHRLLGSWEIPAVAYLEDELFPLSVRLYGQRSGVSGLNDVNRFVFDASGTLLSDEVLHFAPGLNNGYGSSAWSTAINSAATRVMSLAGNRSISLLRSEFDEVGRIDDFPVLAAGVEPPLSDTIALVGRAGSRTEVGSISFNADLRLTAQGEPVPLAEYPGQFLDDRGFNDYTEGPGWIAVWRGGEWLGRTNGIPLLGGFEQESSVSHGFDPAPEIVVEVEIVVGRGQGGIRIGSESGWTIELILDHDEQSLSLGRTGPVDQVAGVVIPLEIVATSVYRIALLVEAGVPGVVVQSNALWQQQVDAAVFIPVSTATLDDQFLLAVGAELSAIDENGLSAPVRTFEGPISETRVWNPAGEATRIGVCLPEQSRVMTGQSLAGSVRFPSNGEIGESWSGAQPGEFSYPLSMDGAPDGRVYVLDAGNSRIQVFDERGNYITEWGSNGDEAGAFRFKLPTRASRNPFQGSIAVDGDGFIYVLDTPNGRIQKFAP
ncbi:MAG: hypothetical protein GKR89_20440 [Candidatus Latescibacteria bacterium]|nr:hypothetical protein [Candidatus Latescibacterota bacterium]